MKAICQELNVLLQGWFEYFKHSKSHVFATIDSYTRAGCEASCASAAEAKAEAGAAIISGGPTTSFTPKA